jgi:histidinol-phosphate aminotransferase
MSRIPDIRPDLSLGEGYHSPQVEAEVRLNTNESPFPGRSALVFEPTYALHSHISHLTGTAVLVGTRTDEFEIDPTYAKELLAAKQPDVTFICSPNNPTGRAEPRATVVELLGAAPGLVIVDEAYGQFSSWSALELRTGPDAAGLVVTRTFSKTWAMAGARLGYLVAAPAVVEACGAVVLPYHLSTQTQLAGLVALRHKDEMESRVALISEERGRMAAALRDLPVQSWPSDANFILFRPISRSADEVWQGLLEHSILIRNCTSWDGLPGCLRVTIGRPGENDRFLTALKECL